MFDSRELKNLNKKLNKTGEKLMKAVVTMPAGVTRELALGANEIRNTIIESMINTPKSGRKYKRGKKTHISSSPGNPPAVDRGELISRILYDVRDMEVEVGNVGGAPYYEFLELGTKKMEARPSLGPAIEEHEDKIINSVGKEAFKIIGDSFRGL